MAILNTRRTYRDGSILFQIDLDNLVNDVETFLNVTKIDDDNIQDAGITASTKLIDASISTGKLASKVVTTDKIADAAVTETQLAASVAGDGLSGGAGTALAVNVDGSTIEINADTLRVKDAGIPLVKLSVLPDFDIQTFTSSGTWTCPTGLSAVRVGGCGGGGGGGGYGPTNSVGGSGGDGAPYWEKVVPVTAGTTYTVTVGAGGTGGSGSDVSGTDGVASSFGSLVSFAGGKGGLDGDSAWAAATSGSPAPLRLLLPSRHILGSALGGQPALFGSGGVYLNETDTGTGQSNAQYTGGSIGVGSIGKGGGGGAGPYGNGGNGSAGSGDTGPTAGAAAANTGAGGGGGGGSGGGYRAGANGGSGRIVVMWPKLN